MNSTLWVLLIILGGAFVVIGNIYYNRAVVKESNLETVKIGRELLHPEMLENHQLAFTMIDALNKDELIHQQFSTGAWEVATRANLIASMPKEELRAITQSYQHIMNANEHQRRLIEPTTGPGLALTSAPKNQEVVKANFAFELTEITRLIQPLLTSEPKSDS